MKKIESAFVAEGHEVVLDYTDSEKKAEDNNPSSNGLKSTLKRLLKKWPWLYQSIVMRSYLKGQDALLEELKKLNACDLIVEFHSVGSLIGKELAEFWGAKLSIIFDSPVDEQFVEMYGTKSAYWNNIQKSEKLSLEAANKIMVYSPACQDYISKKYEISGKVNVLPCVLLKNNEIQNKPEPNFNIGFIGSFLKWHKVDLLLEVFFEFNRQHPQSKLSLIGFGTEWNRIKSMVDSKKLKEKVYLPGFVSESELNKIKTELSIAVMPGSNWYGSPLKLFEYAECGIPFIAPESKTIKSIFKGKEHCLYIDPQNEHESLLQAIEHLYSNREFRNEIGYNAMQFVKKEYSDSTYNTKLVEYLA